MYMEWISVKDSLPNFYGRYLVVCKGTDIPQIRLYEGSWDSLAEVTHWMELPKRREKWKKIRTFVNN